MEGCEDTKEDDLPRTATPQSIASVITCGSWIQAEDGSLGGINHGIYPVQNSSESSTSLFEVLNKPGLVSRPHSSPPERSACHQTSRDKNNNNNNSSEGTRFGLNNLRCWPQLFQEWLEMTVHPNMRIPLLVVTNVAILAAGILWWGRKSWLEANIVC